MKNKIFYGWVNAVACFAVFLGILGIGGASFSLYLKPMAIDLSISRTAVTTIVSVSTLCGALSAFLYGRIIKKVGMKRMMFIAAVIYVLRFAGYSFLHNILLFYVITAVGGFVSSFLASIPISTIIHNWFVRNRGLILGIVFASSGFGGMISNPLIGRLITEYGWRTAIQIEAAIMAIIVLPAIFLISVDPKEKNAVPLGAETGASAKKSAIAGGLTLTEASKTLSFKLLVAATISFTFGVETLKYTLPAHLTDIGFDLAFAAGIMGTVYIANACGKIGLGIVNDKFGPKVVFVIPMVSFLMGAVILIQSTNQTMIYAAAVLYGISLSVMSVPTPLLIPLLFGRKDYANIFGKFISVLTVSWAICVPFGGASYDVFGSYIPVYIAETVFAVIAIIATLMAIKYRPDFESDMNQDNEEIMTQQQSS